MTLTYFQGYEGTVKFNAAGGTAVELTAAKSWSIRISKQTIKTTPVGMSSETYAGGLISGEGEIELIYTGNNNSFLMSVLSTTDVGQALFELYLSSETNSRIVFNGLITSASYGSSVDDVIVVTCNFITSGDIALEV
jgi:hypothetical protein